MNDRDGRALLLDSEILQPPQDARDRPYRMLLRGLVESSVRFCMLRDDPLQLDDVADVDLLVDPADAALAAGELERAGFLPRRDRRLRAKCVYVRWEAGRFYVVDLHTQLVQAGIVYADAARALARCETSGVVPALCAEDQFLHLLLHNLLGKKALQEKHAQRMRKLLRVGLDRARLEEQTHAFGMTGVLDLALEHFDALESDLRLWGRLRRMALRALLRRPGNAVGAWFHAYGDRLRLRRRPVVLALLGPDGTGKTTFADTLEAMLADSPLRAGRVYMGTWGHDLLPMRQARRLIPPQVSYGRLLAARCRWRVSLTGEEAELVAGGHPGLASLAFATLRYGIKNALFHLALGIELGYRYVRHIAFARRPIVLTDRYVYDLEFRQGRTPFAHGAAWRRLFYRLFPAPDGILYFHAPYEVVAARKPQLDREQFETMDRIFRAVLAPYRPLQITSDTPPDALAREFLTRRWEDLVRRCNWRA
jgi:thymidylate kinase